MTTSLLSEKERHEAFVRTAEGSSFSEIALVLALLPVVVLCERIVVCLLLKTTSTNSYNSISRLILSFLIGLGVIVVPLIFLISKPEWSCWAFIIALLLLLCGLYWRILPKGLVEYSTNDSQVMKTLSKAEKPFITAYRSSLLILTCVAILAVDFSLFPRRFAKTETFGTSLMDVGVGSFMISGALVSKEDLEMNRNALSTRVFKTLKSVGPLLFLGFARLFFVKTVDYQENVSEYGVHWNFFFTLALLRLLHSVFVIPTKHSAIVALCVVSLYELILTVGGGAEFVTSNQPRTDFISMNKEGLFSIVGYFSIFLFGLQLGRYLLGEKQRSKAEWVRVLLRLIVIDIICWIVTFLVHNYIQPTSRRMANMGYVFSTLSYNLLSVSGFLAVDLFVKPIAIDVLPTEILDSVNFNSLPLFLLGNILTGLTNLSMRTIDASETVGYLVLIVYMSIIAAFAVFCKHKRWKIRL